MPTAIYGGISRKVLHGERPVVVFPVIQFTKFDLSIVLQDCQNIKDTLVGVSYMRVIESVRPR